MVPTGVAYSSDGQWIHVADSSNQRVVLLARNGAYSGTWEVTKTNPDLNTPVMIASSPQGNTVYASDIVNHRIIVLDFKPGTDD